MVAGMATGQLGSLGSRQAPCSSLDGRDLASVRPRTYAADVEGAARQARRCRADEERGAVADRRLLVSEGRRSGTDRHGMHAQLEGLKFDGEVADDRPERRRQRLHGATTRRRLGLAQREQGHQHTAFDHVRRAQAAQPGEGLACGAHRPQLPPVCAGVGATTAVGFVRAAADMQHEVETPQFPCGGVDHRLECLRTRAFGAAQHQPRAATAGMLCADCRRTLGAGVGDDEAAPPGQRRDTTVRSERRGQHAAQHGAAR